jgi:hypothetical protein
MHTLNLSELEHYDASSIYQYLLIHDDKQLEIVIHKETVTGVNDNFEIFWEYYLAAFIGQKLSAIAKTFSYYVPSTYVKEVFRFLITVDNWDALTDILHYLVTGIYETDTDTNILLHHEGAAFLEKASEEQPTDIACWGLLDIAHKHLNNDLSTST